MTVSPRGLQQKRVCWPEDAGAMARCPGEDGVLVNPGLTKNHGVCYGGSSRNSGKTDS